MRQICLVFFLYGVWLFMHCKSTINHSIHPWRIKQINPPQSHCGPHYSQFNVTPRFNVCNYVGHGKRCYSNLVPRLDTSKTIAAAKRWTTQRRESLGHWNVMPSADLVMWDSGSTIAWILPWKWGQRPTCEGGSPSPHTISPLYDRRSHCKITVHYAVSS